MKDMVSRMLKKRMFLLGVLFFLMLLILIRRFYILQIRDGRTCQEAFETQIEREQIYYGSRGIIYDRKGTELAYNEISYTVTIADSGTYENRDSRNQTAGAVLGCMVMIVMAVVDYRIIGWGLAVGIPFGGLLLYLVTRPGQQMINGCRFRRDHGKGTWK